MLVAGCAAAMPSDGGECFDGCAVVEIVVDTNAMLVEVVADFPERGAPGGAVFESVVV